MAAYERALAIKPDFAEAAYNRGHTLRELDRREDALAAFARATAVKPDHVEAFYNHGLTLQELRRFDEALASYDRALAIKPDHAGALTNRGLALHELKRFDEALASYDRALAIRPDHAVALTNRGLTLHELKRFDEALACYGRALAIAPDHVQAFNGRGTTFHELRRHHDALADYDRALAIKPDYAEALDNRGLSLHELDRLEEALAHFDRALAIMSDHAPTFNNRGVTLHELGRFAAAVDDYERALALKPDFADAGFNRGLTRLLNGQFAQGWRDYEFRHDVKGPTSPRPPVVAPTWNREPLRDKSIVVFWEQGHGDIVQIARYLHALNELGARVTFLAPRNLQRLLRPLAGPVELTSALDGARAFAFQCPLMSLPLKFETDLGSIPNAVPYLRAEPELAARWREKIGRAGFKVGICWQGNPIAKVDKGRSVPLVQFAPLARLPEVRLVSLQKHHGLDQLDRLPADVKVETLGDDFDAGPDAFVDTAAVMMSLDLVVTSDTAMAHLAGALARPTWVALKHVPDWRWLIDRDDCPWYPGMRLFRQPERGNWDAVFARIAEELRALLATR